MGRILEALRQADARRGRAVETLPPRHEEKGSGAFSGPRDNNELAANARPEKAPDPFSSAEPGEETPFIEVGGPRTSLDASPSVLASIQGPFPRSPVRQTRLNHAHAPGIGGPEKGTVPLSSSKGQSPFPDAGVTFLPLPREMTPLRPAAERFAPELIALHQPNHPVSQQYRVLMNALAQQLPAGQSQVLLFAAAAPGTDSTTVVLNLAITRAKHGKESVVVVDANLGRPAVGDRVGLPSVLGLCDVLAGTISIQRALQETGHANLHAVTAGRVAATSVRQVAGEGMRAVLRHLRGRFPWVLVDAPCWDGRPDVVALGAACDAVYLVLPEADANTTGVEELIQLIPEQGGCLRGCVLTKA